jgi:hypothetical protein
MNVVKSILWIIINYFIARFINDLVGIDLNYKGFMDLMLLSQNILYILLCFIDPGTIFEDEEDALQEERSFCMTCSVYRLSKSRHCFCCNKCVQRYDHHCSFFGKCIAKRNLLIFYAFLLVCGLEMPSFAFILLSRTVPAPSN